MSTEEIEVPHQDGPAWKIVGRFPTFEGADAKRNELTGEADLQVKIHYQGPSNRKIYAVKTRIDPAIAKREEKRRRKAKLSKKRRKK
tara:strand:+ start:177 stop:437 length:261 start_codon:yes stop_codon:yes gene_type:complete